MFRNFKLARIFLPRNSLSENYAGRLNLQIPLALGCAALEIYGLFDRRGNNYIHQMEIRSIFRNL